MSLLRSLYPISLAGLNIGVGWLLFRLEILFGLLLLAAGVLVLIATVCSTANNYIPGVPTRI